MICGCGEPYQTASVPHSTRSSPTCDSSLPSSARLAPAGASGCATPMPRSTHTLEFGGHAVRVERGEQPVDADRCAPGCTALRCDSSPSSRGTRRTACRGRRATPRPCLRARCASSRSRGAASPCAPTMTFTPRSRAFCTHRKTDRGIVERVALTVRAPRGVHLERGDLARRRGRLHPVEPLVAGRRSSGAITLCTSTRDAPPRVSCAANCCVPTRVGERHRRVVGPGVGHVGEHRDRRVARQEQVVQVRGAVRALERVGRRALREHAADDRRRSSGAVWRHGPCGMT